MNKKRTHNIKVHVKKGDTVKVISGDDKNKTGEVQEVFPEKGTALVQGVNLVTKHKKPDADNPDGSIVKKEAAIRLSKLMVVSGGEASRIGRKLNDSGKLQRYSKKSGEFIN
jgi:large subunit ribosomal protein L24